MMNYTYIDDYEQFIERVRRYDKGIFEDGKEEGVEIGREIGREQGKIEVAKKMKSRGMDIDSISEITGLPVSQVENL